MRIIRFIDQRFEEFICSIMLGYIAVSLNIEVFDRYVLNAPSAYTDEIARTLMIFIVFLGVPWAVKTNRHVIIDLLPISSDWKKIRLIVDIVSKVLFILFCVAFIVASTRAAEFHHMLGSVTEGLEVPYWMLLGMLPVIFSLTIVRLLQSMWITVKQYKENDCCNNEKSLETTNKSLG